VRFVLFRCGVIVGRNGSKEGGGDDKGRTRYVIEFVLGPFSELEILARGKAKPEAEHANEELPMEEAA
jgi:hypothetical protein